MMPRPKVITLGTYIRNLPWSIFNYIANELDAPGSCTNWKDFVMKIPISATNPQPRFSMNEIRKFETLSMRGESPTIAIIDAWGTYNCTVDDLLTVLQSLNLHNSAQRVRQLVSTLPRYEDVAVSARDPPSYRQSVENTSIYRPQSTSNHHSELMASLTINSAENKQVNVRCFPYSDLLELTYSFDDKLKLGEGAFGSVFKGHINTPNKLPDAEGSESSSKTVAIKRLKLESSETSHAIIEQFKKEIHVISELKHQNILPLLGYSCDGPELCLIYEYMFNDSLSFNLSQCRTGKTHMSDVQRIGILLGSSKGINYLHERNIIHRDVKTSNILLDCEMIPRISDFGLIRSLGGSNKDRLSTQTTNPIGTLVYMAPEAYLGTITYAMDVYSFGVVILEMLSGLEVMDDTREPNHLALYVEDLIEDEKSSQVFDTSAGSWQGVGDDLLQISTDCLERKFKKRPKITEVITRIASLVPGQP